MAGSTVFIKFKLEADGRGLKNLTLGAETLRKALDAAVSEAERLNGSMVNFSALAVGLDSMSASLGNVRDVFADLSSAYSVQEVAETKLATAMHNTMNATAEQVQSIKDLCSAQQELGVIGDEVQLQGAQELATYLTMTDTLRTLIPVMNDMVAQQYGLGATGESAAQIATMLGKVMNGQVNALSRYGYTFDEAQEKILKFGTESQRAAVLADVVGQSVGGMNEALAQTDAGKQKQLENALGDLKEKAGELTGMALPFVTMAANSLIALNGVVKLTAGVKTAITTMTAWNVRGAATQVMLKILGIQTVKTTTLSGALGNAFQLCSVKAVALKVAMRGLMIASGVGIAIAALSALIDIFAGSTSKATDSTNDLIDAEKRAEREAQRLEELRREETSALESARAALSVNISRLKAFNGTKAQEKKIVEEMNNTYGETMGYFASVSDWYKALTANSAAYCRQMVLEAKLRTTANQIAQKEQENYDITHNSDGSKRKYSKTREQVPVYAKGVTPLSTATAAATAPPVIVGYKDKPGSKSDLDKAQDAYNANVAIIKSLEKQMADAAAEAASLTFSVRGSEAPPAEPTTGHGTTKQQPTEAERAAALDVTEIMSRNLDSVAAYDAALSDLALKQKYSGAEEYQAIQKNIDALKTKRDQFAGVIQLTEAERAAAVDVSAVMARQRETFKDIEDAIGDLQLKQRYSNAEEYQAIQRNIDALQKEKDAYTGVMEVETPTVEVKTVNPMAATLAEIEENIEVLRTDLQTATIEEAASLNQSIALWEEKAEAIRSAGKAQVSAFETFRSGWGAVKGMDGAIGNMTKTLQGNGSVWQKVISVVDAFVGVYDGIKTVIGILEALGVITKGVAVAKTVEAAATTEAAVAQGVAAAEAPATVAADAAVTAANKVAAASFMQMASAAYMAAHAAIPFLGFGIGSGFTASALAVVKGAGAISAFADGGIAYGPTLGLFGEYAGASHNPEVVAPLDKLRGLIGEGNGGEVRVTGELRARSGELVALIRNEIRRMSR